MSNMKTYEENPMTYDLNFPESHGDAWQSISKDVTLVDLTTEDEVCLFQCVKEWDCDGFLWAPLFFGPRREG